MKLYRFLLAAVPALMMSACSDDAPVANEGGTTPNPEAVADGFIGVNIQLPTSPVSRAIGDGTGSNNDVFDDGEESEYTINTGAVVLFVGNNELTAKFQGAYKIKTDNENDDVDSDNITATYRNSVQIQNFQVPAGQKIFALALLNYSNVCSVTSDFKLGFNDQSQTFTGTFGDFLNKLSWASYKSPDGYFYATQGNGIGRNFFMTNAPIATYPGGWNRGQQSGDPHYLSFVDPAKIKTTAREARENPACDIFVERAVAKATIKLKTGLTVNPTGATGSLRSIKVKKAEAALMAREQSSYLVRNLGDNYGNEWIAYASAINATEGGHYLRMIGNTPIGKSVLYPFEKYYRIYWAVDPHYTTDAAALDGEKASYKTMINGTTKQPEAFYCYENTMPLSKMSDRNMNYFRVRLTLDLDATEFPGGDFYVLNGDMKKIYNEAGAHKVQTNLFAGDTKTTDFIKQYLKDGVTVNPLDCFTITWSYDTKTGVEAISKITWKALGASVFKGNPEAAALKAFTDVMIKQINDEYRFELHKGGVCNYIIDVKHFGDDLTPWNAKDHLDTDNMASAYGTGLEAERNYCGRFGMLRNNWYDITINTITDFGKPVEDPHDIVVPSDQTNKYLGFTVNVMSWAKRVQNADL